MSGPETSPSGGLWARIATLVHDHPVRVFVASLALVALPALAVPTIRLSYDTLDELPRHAESVRSFDTLADHFPPGELSPLVLVIDDDAPVTEPASLRAVGDLSRMLRRLETVESVRSVAMPTNGERPDVQASSQQIEEFRSFDEQLAQAAEGARQLRDGIAELDAGLARIHQRLPALSAGLDDGEEGVARLLEGIREARDGVQRLRDAAERLQAGSQALSDGLVEARDGTQRLRDDVAVPAETAIRSAWETLFEEFSVGRSDPEYRDALEEVGEVYGRITGDDPRTGRQANPDYDGLAPALAELADGLDEAVGGAERLEAGTGRLTSGLVDLDAGLARVADGLVPLRSGLAEGAAGVQQLMDGIERLRGGAARLESGAAELRSGLAQGAAGVREVDLASLVPGLGGGEDGAPFMVTAGLLDAMPEVREELDLFLTRDETRTRLFVGLSTDPFANEAVASVEEILHLARVSVRESPLEDAAIEATGATALYDAVDAASDRDLPLLVGAVVLGVFAVLVLLLRAIIAPLYMVATVLLSFASALGLTAVLFQGVLGHHGLVWWLPSFLFVLLVALGADYNIYLMSRVREEADSKPTRRAVADATQATGGVITSAGLILAGTFAALMVAEVSSLVQMGFATTVGILLDTFVVRSLLVPALATLLGRHNWWPSRRASAAAEM